MGSRLDLHSELVKFLPNVYFQPPSNIQMSYPCIVYNKTSKEKQLASNTVYLERQGYNITVIDRNPDSDIADRIERKFQYCDIIQYYVSDNLNHTVLKLLF